MNKHYLIPDWPAPEGINCLVTTRRSGQENLQADIGKENSLQWLKQVHGSRAFQFDSSVKEILPEADALYAATANRACGVLTADCLPVFFCDQKGEEIAVAHAGWRGLSAGILENTVSCFRAEPERLMAWFGPAIGPCHFEVGNEVREAFIDASDPSIAKQISSVFVPSINAGKWMADIFQLARLRLSFAGLNQIYGGGLCTFCNKESFYSYRRAKDSDRMASIIWKE